MPDGASLIRPTDCVGRIRRYVAIRQRSAVSGQRFDRELRKGQISFHEIF
ncbi:hypothetical protein CKO_00656 [Citrobacter koseri ATCC BAA-895]|uniref:Uncharacterized protein n=1 Tax=Citrobacter koseri (strain ATCC BAA-895 / CDC 4225-83 / SGSC4696) TaxID=290338 RepID=A8AE97_CITK8|nr:hypothetical protein CKO_00656 [Citrobacter koseri ATCC BAA-895]